VRGIAPKDKEAPSSSGSVDATADAVHELVAEPVQEPRAGAQQEDGGGSAWAPAPGSGRGRGGGGAGYVPVARAPAQAPAVRGIAPKDKRRRVRRDPLNALAPVNWPE